MVFRRDDDKGSQRLKSTQTTETLVNNLDQFSRKWKHISETSTDGPLLRELSVA